MFNILVVEDNLDLREMLSAALGDAGYRAIGAENGKRAMDILSNTVVDLIIADIMMPAMDGFELTKSLREADIFCPLIIVTARTTTIRCKRRLLWVPTIIWSNRSI